MMRRTALIYEFQCRTPLELDLRVSQRLLKALHWRRISLGAIGHVIPIVRIDE